jgi:hypothetical protein
MSKKPRPDEDDDKAAEDAFTEGVLERGEAVPEGEDLPSGATHEVVEEVDGKKTVRRRRFSAF